MAATAAQSSGDAGGGSDGHAGNMVAGRGGARSYPQFSASSFDGQQDQAGPPARSLRYQRFAAFFVLSRSASVFYLPDNCLVWAPASKFCGLSCAFAAFSAPKTIAAVSAPQFAGPKFRVAWTQPGTYYIGLNGAWSTPRLALWAPRNCSWPPRNIHCCNPYGKIVWAQIAFLAGPESRGRSGETCHNVVQSPADGVHTAAYPQVRRVSSGRF